MKITAKHSSPIVSRTPGQQGIWEKWMDDKMNDIDFVTWMQHIVGIQGWAGISKDKATRAGIQLALDNFNKNKDYRQAAQAIGDALSMGKLTNEKMASKSNWYKRATDENITGPDMSKLNPTQTEEINEWLKQHYPNLIGTVEGVRKWLTEHFGENLPNIFTGPKNVARRPLD